MLDITKKEPPKADITTHTIIVKGKPQRPVVLAGVTVKKPQETVEPAAEAIDEKILFEVY
jgi:hypothetical protein